MNEFAKDTDGFFARHFDRRISGAISEQLLKTSITPNQITVGVTLLGLFAGACLARPGYGPKVAGAFLFLLTSILDGCDGEVARAKRMSSRLGGWLDLWGDNLVHMAVFYGLGIGLFRDTGLSLYRDLGAIAAAGTFIAALLASVQILQRGGRASGPDASLFTSVVPGHASPESAWQKRLIRLSDALARRDFIYAVVVLALVNRLDWFLWACSIGVVLYALNLALLTLLVPRSDG